MKKLNKNFVSKFVGIYFKKKFTEMMSAVDDTAWTQRKLKGWIND